MISIHAPLAGRDVHRPYLRPAARDFNPRAPRGARPFQVSPAYRSPEFQSTRPSRGATVEKEPALFKLSIFQSTRPSRGATSYILAHLETVPISIHAPLAGRDPLHGAVDQHRRNKFQSTRPSRGATAWAVDIVGESRISIHAPLAGRDYLPPRVLDAGGDFNPRAPRGARLCVVSRGCGGKSFQSTRPSRGATGGASGVKFRFPDFNPRAPRGARQAPFKFSHWRRYFNPRAPRGARQLLGGSSEGPYRHFNPRAPRGARRTWARPRRRSPGFQSTRPSRGATTGCWI